MADQNEDQTPDQTNGAPEAAETPAPEAPAAEPTPEQEQQPVPELTFGGGTAVGDLPEYTPVTRGKIDRFGVAIGTGRRKTSVARIRLKEGKGQFTINGRTLEDYCPLERNRKMIEAPLRATDRLGKVDVWVRVEGGGTTGQAGAILLGISRALEALDHGYHHLLHEHGFLTRDERMVERKKYGRKKARRSFQFSKR